MLLSLCLENYVLFEKAELTFSPGLNVISGETGSGKSLVAGAISAALGQRASSGVIRANCKSASSSVKFDVNKALLKKLATMSDLELPGDHVEFTRQLNKDNRSRLLLNGTTLPVSKARDAFSLLVDMAAQNEHTRIMDTAYQLELLDRFGKNDKEVTKFSSLFRKALNLKKRLEAGDAEKERIIRRLENIRLDLEDIEKTGYDEKTDSQLEERIKALSNAEAIAKLSGEAVDALYEEEDSIYGMIAGLLSKSKEFNEFCNPVRDGSNSLSEALVHIEEAANCFREASDSLNCPQGELEAIIERSEMLKKLARRLGCDVSGIPEKEKELVDEEEELREWEADTDQIKKELDLLLQQVSESGLLIRKKRIKVAKKLSLLVNKELSELGMDKADFSIEINSLWEKDDPLDRILEDCQSSGFDEVCFLIAPNPGEAASALSDTASGGEASRAMLAVKCALSEVHNPSVMFFDEIDAGIGGRLGDEIGKKLRQLAKKRQVLVITHLPQIAAFAETHISVSKKVVKGRTIANANSLDAEQRVVEIAQMIRGSKSNETTHQQAREMLMERK